MIVSTENARFDGQQALFSVGNSEDIPNDTAAVIAAYRAEIKQLHSAVKELSDSVDEISSSVDDDSSRIDEMSEELDETKELALELMDEVGGHTFTGFDICALASHFEKTGENKVMLDNLAETVNDLDDTVSDIKQELSYLKECMDERYSDEDAADGYTPYVELSSRIGDLDVRLESLEMRLRYFDMAANTAFPVIFQLLDNMASAVPKLQMLLKGAEEQLCIGRNSENLPF